MKNILIYSAIVALFLTDCTLIFADKRMKGDGNVTVEQREVTAFDKINIGGVFNIYLTQGDTESVEVEIDENLQQYVKVYNKENTLYLNIDKGINWGKATRNNVYVTFKNIDDITVGGVCSVKTTNILNLENLKLVLNGVSNCSFELKCNQLDAKLSGVGNTEIAGEAYEFTAIQDGVGKLKANELKAAIVSIKNSGVGSAQIYASEELTMKNTGVGSIYYSGDAVIKSIESGGIGKIRKD